MDYAELTDRDRAALKVVELAKALVLADNHFLSTAVDRLRIRPGRFLMLMATNGFELGIDSSMVCDMFLTTKEPSKHDFLHVVLHYVFLRPYVGAAIDRRLFSEIFDMSLLVEMRLYLSRITCKAFSLPNSIAKFSSFNK